MSSSAEHTDPALWDKVKNEVTKGSKGGRPGQWSARKAQMATAEYEKRGGGFEGRKRADNSLRRWTEEEWGTKSGGKSRETGERYLPKKARDELSEAQYARTSAKKRRDTRKGRQFSDQPKDVAGKTARHRRAVGGASAGRDGSRTRAELYAEARKRGVPGRSKMSKSELEKALAR